MTAYIKTMAESLQEMYSLNEDNMDLMRKAAKGSKAPYGILILIRITSPP